MPEKHTMEHVLRTLAALNHEVILYGADGVSVPTGIRRSVPVFDERSDMVLEDGHVWMHVQAHSILYVCVSGDDQAAQDCARLAAALVTAVLVETPASDQDDVVRAALREELSGPELEALVNEFSIPMELDRCVLLLHGTSSGMRDLIVVEEDDMLIDMDRHSMVLLKSMASIEDADDLLQLAEAMEQTIMSETGEQPMISIGEIKPTMLEIGASYRAAWRALEIGRIFHPKRTVFSFGRLVLERFLSEINRELGIRYHHMLFNRKTQRLFNDEMLHTIDMFFAKDLNLSDTARQLYIHRNTLVYRLDKIQRQTGLDLRRFEDAITFRMLLLLGKSGGDRPLNVR
ncbi:MAG: helix-turn-helix domain-containing protein [Clostridia bacterium]|nr:helix-turn-helix domain-containing protein [Clostridia bacterium]